MFTDRIYSYYSYIEAKDRDTDCQAQFFRESLARAYDRPSGFVIIVKWLTSAARYST